MNSLREVIAALFHRKFHHGEARHAANGGAVPKESPLENEGIGGIIYVGIRICTKYSFFVKPTVIGLKVLFVKYHTVRNLRSSVSPEVSSSNSTYRSVPRLSTSPTNLHISLGSYCTLYLEKKVGTMLYQTIPI